MHFKLIVALVEESLTDTVLDAAREAGAKGSTVINSARGEGVRKTKSFFGLNLESQRDIVLLLVEEHLSRHMLERISSECRFDEKPGRGIAFQIDVEDAVGVRHQINELYTVVEEVL
jgi:nitrogen regulatory protein PII